MMATLPGVKLYAVCGYVEGERVGAPIGDGIEIECVKMSKILS